MEKDGIIIDERENWRAVINNYGETLCLSFETKPRGTTIQGEVDEALEDIYGWETKIGIEDLEMEMDDSLYLVYYGDCPKERHDELRPQIIAYLTKIYNENKERFEERILADLKDYEEYNLL